eukprot:2436279-Amphidinium_carterae.1
MSALTHLTYKSKLNVSMLWLTSAIGSCGATSYITHLDLTPWSKVGTFVKVTSTPAFSLIVKNGI